MLLCLNLHEIYEMADCFFESATLIHVSLNYGEIYKGADVFLCDTAHDF